MDSPLTNLILFLLGGALAASVFWPGRGVLARGQRGRALAGRIMVEDALKHLYHLEARGQTCTLASVAGAVEIGSGRAVALVDRMQQGGLVRVYDGRIVLTDDGRRYALDVVRAHRLWERYLADETGVDPLEWHARAERREHAMTRDETDALAARLGHPRFDPHGDPIPTADGDVAGDESSLLSTLARGERAVVTHIEDEPHAVFAQLVALGMYLGMEVRVTGRTDTQIELETDGRTLALAPLLADNVSVRRAEDEAGEVGSVAIPTLADLVPGQGAEVRKVSPACRGIERRRLMDLGIVPGTHVVFERRGLTGGLCAYRVRDTLIALREEQASMIHVTKVADPEPELARAARYRDENEEE